MSFEVRPAHRTDVATMLDWARNEGWNPGIEDVDGFFSADPGGFFLGFEGDDPVGAISMVKYGDSFAFLGLYIVRPDHRGKGHGKAIWDAAMATVAGYTIGLDGVVAQQANYQKSGFEFAHNNLRRAGAWTGPSRPAMQLDAPSSANLEEFVAYEADLFPAPRKFFLAEWLFGGSTRKTLCCRDAGKLRGYGTIRVCAEGYKIGPLFADTSDIAEALLIGLVAEMDARQVILDVPQTNKAAVALAEKYGLDTVFETARMYRGEAPRLAISRVFGITTFELG